MDYQINQYGKQDDLLHYGMLGMKWGVRNDGSYSKTGARAKSFVNRVSAKNSATTYGTLESTPKYSEIRKAKRLRKDTFKDLKRMDIKRLMLPRGEERSRLENKIREIASDSKFNDAVEKSRLMSLGQKALPPGLLPIGLGPTAAAYNYVSTAKRDMNRNQDRGLKRHYQNI